MRFLIIAALLLLAGCATPSKITETYVIFKGKPVLEKKVIEYSNSTFSSGKQIGLKIGYDPASHSPTVKFIYGRYESARVNDNMWYSSDYGLNNISLITGAGTAHHFIQVGPKDLYEPIKKLKRIEK